LKTYAIVRSLVKIRASGRITLSRKNGNFVTGKERDTFVFQRFTLTTSV